MNGQQSLLEIDANVEVLAKHYASLLIDKNLKRQKNADEKGIKNADYEEVDINSVKANNLRSIGGEYVSLETLNKIVITTILKDLGFNDDQINIAKLLIIGRMVYPVSELATYNWERKISAASELLNLNMDGISHNFLYRVSDLLIENKERIEEKLNEKIILYDLTNNYFESSRTSALKRYGRSKDKRNDQPLVTLGLVIDKSGLFRQNNEIILFCRSDFGYPSLWEKKHKETSMRSKFQKRFESDLRYAAESLRKKRGTKKYAKELERIGRLKERHARVAYFYDIKIKEKGGIVTTISWLFNKE